jgi:catechol 2,3-dioxygenase-like lactoylglutathione lyase family enzyme
MDWKLELVVVPVTDVDRSKRFYSEQVGFAVDHDTRIDDDVHIVQLTPPGSGCSIAIATGMVKTPPGSVEGRRRQPGPALRGRHPRRRPRRPLELLHLLQRPRRQRLGRPGAPSHLSGTGPPNPLL